MPITYREHLIGAYAFLIGIILAVVAGILGRNSINSIIFSILILLGLIMGYFVAEKNSQTFLLASVSLVLVSFAGIQGLLVDTAIRGISFGNITFLGVEVGKIISSILSAFLLMFVPATVIVALKTVFALARK